MVIVNCNFLLTRLRTNCSALAHDLFCKNIITSPNCLFCGDVETIRHYFLHCNRYNNIRLRLLNEISRYSPVSLDVLLNGNPSLTYEQNTLIFSAVFSYCAAPCAAHSCGSLKLWSWALACNSTRRYVPWIRSLYAALCPLDSVTTVVGGLPQI